MSQTKCKILLCVHVTSLMEHCPHVNLPEAWVRDIGFFCIGNKEADSRWEGNSGWKVPCRSLVQRPALLLSCPHGGKMYMQNTVLHTLYEHLSLCLLSFILPPCTTVGSLAPSPPSPSIIPHRYEAFPPPELSFLVGQVLQPQPPWGLSAANLTLLNLSSLCPKQLFSRSELKSAQQMQVISSFSGAVLLFIQPRVSLASLAAWAHC